MIQFLPTDHKNTHCCHIDPCICNIPDALFVQCIAQWIDEHRESGGQL